MNDAYNNATVGSTDEFTEIAENYQPNPDELRVFAQCRTDSNIKAAVTALITGGLAYQSIKTFNLSISPKYGVYPKVGSACLFGFFVGKLLSIPSCYEKFKQLPNSPIGAHLRRKAAARRGSSDMESSSDANLGFAVINPSSDPDNDKMNSAIDIDVYNSPSNLDSYTGNELNGPNLDGSNDDLPNRNYIERPAVSYAELRRRNREENLRADKEKHNLASSIANDAPEAQPAKRLPPPSPAAKTNQYGDVWE